MAKADQNDGIRSTCSAVGACALLVTASAAHLNRTWPAAIIAAHPISPPIWLFVTGCARNCQTGDGRQHRSGEGDWIRTQPLFDDPSLYIEWTGQFKSP